MPHRFRVLAAALLAVMAFSFSSARAETFSCTPDRVGVLPSHIYIECYYGQGSQFLYIFMMPTTDAEQAKRALNMMSLSMLTGRLLKVDYEARPINPPVATCAPDKCRKLIGVGLSKLP